jgi:hypothetical protein
VLNSRQLLRNGSALVFLILATLLTACGGQTVPSTTCSAETLGAAANLSPNDVVLDASKPVTLAWTYSDPACTPDHYEVTLGTSSEGGAPGSTQTSASTAMNWPGALTQGTTYFWTVYPVVYNNGQAVRGPGQLAYFYTGPVCAADAALMAPVAVYPPEGASLDPSTRVTLRWDDPTNCLPDGNFEIAGLRRGRVRQPDRPPDRTLALHLLGAGRDTGLHKILLARAGAAFGTCNRSVVCDRVVPGEQDRQCMHVDRDQPHADHDRTSHIGPADCYRDILSAGRFPAGQQEHQLPQRPGTGISHPGYALLQ